MEVITRRRLAEKAADKWKRQYPPGSDKRHDAIGCKLRELGPHPDPDAVDAAIGNSSWTDLWRCDECDSQAAVIVRLGEEPDYESSTAYVCLPCLRKAVGMAEEATP